MSEEAMVTMCFVLPASMKSALEDRAREDDRSVSSLLRMLLVGPVEAWQKQKARQEALQSSRPAPRTPVAAAARTFEE